jgi:hypothetical protein
VPSDAAPVLSEVKLGKRLGVVNDPRTLTLRPLLEGGVLPTPPPASELGRGKAVPMFANNRAGDCTFVTHGHRSILQEAASGQRGELPITDDDVLGAYAALTGYNPATGENDNGAYMLDVLNFMRTVGLGRQKDGTPHTIAAFVRINHRDEAEVRVASWLFGGLAAGVWLPWSARSQDLHHWDVPEGGPVGSGEPGSWGGHSIFTTGYGRKGVPFKTWGADALMTWQFWHAYVDEAYAVISNDYLRRSGATRHGFAVAQLQAFLSQLNH